MRRTTLFKVILALLFLISNQNFANIAFPKTKINKSLFANIAPIITASGNQIYCPQTSLKIVSDVTIIDPDDTSTDAIYIQISSGYVNGQDLLTLTNLASHLTITTSWDTTAGKLKLSSPVNGTQVSYLEFIAAIKDVEFSNSSSSPSGTRDFSISIGQANYLPRNGHYYEFVPFLDINWTDAKLAAEGSYYYGLQGYLATITAADEAKISGEQAAGAGWIGGSDAETEGIWKWVTGPEGLANGGNGTIFWNGLANGSAPNYANWNTNEPNQAGDEDYAHITAPGVGNTGAWNDLKESGDPSGNYQPKGYIVEYGGMPRDPVLLISASTRITISKITGTTVTTNCSPGVLTLEATASVGTINWYDTATSTTSLHSGSSFDTPYLNTTTTYYVDAGCISTRTPVIATIKTIPIITSTTPSIVCDLGTATLGAVASAGTINWYATSTGGTSLSTGSTFTTPNITTTTTYYVDAISDGCISSARTAVTATVNIAPTVISTTPASRCDSGTVTLEALASSGNINWYKEPTGGTILFTGNSFLTPTIESTTFYYAEAFDGGCPSNRLPVTATVYPISTVTQEIILCQGETTTLDATIPNMNYLWSPGGETTQTISVSTIGDYSVSINSQTVVSCESKKNISVIEHPKPIISLIEVNENSIVIELANPESYFEYSINGFDFQVSNEFSYIPSGQHTAFVRENNGCNLVAQNFTIFTIQKYFTPNNDGFNDVWKIKEMSDYPNSTAQIFDRYGKLIIDFTSVKYSWNGTYNNKLLPADDYWYVLKLDDTKPEIRGHFSLKR